MSLKHKQIFLKSFLTVKAMKRKVETFTILQLHPLQFHTVQDLHRPVIFLILKYLHHETFLKHFRITKITQIQTAKNNFTKSIIQKICCRVNDTYTTSNDLYSWTTSMVQQWRTESGTSSDRFVSFPFFLFFIKSYI